MPPVGSIKASPMSLLWSLVILVAVNAATIAAMLLVRRRAPEGSYFTDGDRASGVFGVSEMGVWMAQQSCQQSSRVDLRRPQTHQDDLDGPSTGWCPEALSG